MIGVVDVGLGNTASVYKALNKLNIKHFPIRKPIDAIGVNSIIFPGVGTFSSAVSRLKTSGLFETIQKHLEENKPYLGICLGMQLLAKHGLEGQKTNGFGMLDASVEKMTAQKDIRLPHIGWNSIKHNQKGLFLGIKSPEDFYFLHSFSMLLNENCESYTFSYGENYIGYVNKNNIFGVQFHPEKSQKSGLILIENFCKC